MYEYSFLKKLNTTEGLITKNGNHFFLCPYLPVLMEYLDISTSLTVFK